MPAFLSAIQGYFKAEFSGRYMGVLLSEVCRADPRPFKRYFAAQFENRNYLAQDLRLDPEYSFRARSGSRRADLAVFLDGKLAALIELKFDDKLLPKTRWKAAQLSDYLRTCRLEELDFLLLSKDPPSLTDQEKLRRRGQKFAHFSRLAEELRGTENPASQMLFEYFRERELVVDPLNEDHLYRFFHRILKPWGHSGRINSKDALSEGPAQFQALLAFMRLVAGDLNSTIRPPASTSRNRGPTIDFQLDPRFGAKELTRDLKRQEGEGDVIQPSDKARRGGTVYVYAMHPLGGKGKKWLYLEYGLAFQVRPGGIRSLSPFLFAQVYGQGFTSAGIDNEYWEEAIRFSTLAKPENVGDVTRKLLRVIRRAARSAAKLELITRQGRAALLRI